MKRPAAVITTTLLVMGTLGIAAPSAEAAATFKNCTALHQVYKNGVARSTAAANKQKNRPKVSAKLYAANTRLDRDKDGTACERS